MSSMEWYNGTFNREQDIRGRIVDLLDDADVSDLNLSKMDGPVLFASDLDHTLINSIRHVNMESTGGLVSVETYQAQPFAFITPVGLEMLHLIQDLGVLAPVTSRSVAQFRRVHLPYDVAVVANGGMMVRGDEESVLADGVNQPQVQELWGHIKETYQDKTWFKNCGISDNMFVYVSATSLDLLPWKAIREMRELARSIGYKFSHQGRKMYLVPPTVTKSSGLSRLIENIEPSYVISAGDSALDLPMSEVSDVFLAPRWGELYEEDTPGVRFVGEHSSHGVRTAEQLIAQALKIVLTVRGDL